MSPKPRKFFKQIFPATNPNPPGTQNDFNCVNNPAMAYAAFDADESFRLTESMLPTLNEIMQAHFVLLKFRNCGGFRQGETRISAANRWKFIISITR